MKRVFLLFIVSLLMMTACSNTSISATTEESCSVENTTVQSSQSISTTVTTTTEFTYEAYIPEYEIDQAFINVTFEDVYNLCEEWTGVDLDEMVQNSEDNTIIVVEQDGLKIEYIADYPKYLEMICRPEYYYHPEEFQLHIIRRLFINGLAINEYEDEYWAKVEYCQSLDFVYDDCSMLENSDPTNGYVFSYEEEFLCYHSYYISGNCVLNFSHSLNYPDNSYFVTYLDVCDSLGLPTSSEMTDAIGT